MGIKSSRYPVDNRSDAPQHHLDAAKAAERRRKVEADLREMGGAEAFMQETLGSMNPSPSNLRSYAGEDQDLDPFYQRRVHPQDPASIDL